MITYIEKGAALHAAIADAGYSLQCVDGVWVASDPVAVQAIIDGYPLSSLQAAVACAIDAHAKALRDAVVENISPAEMAAWGIKRAEAAAYLASGNTSNAPMLVIEAQARNVSVADLVQKVVNKATLLAQLEAVIAGVAGAHSDAVRAFATFEDVLSYNWHIGWPEV